MPPGKLICHGARRLALQTIPKTQFAACDLPSFDRLGQQCSPARFTRRNRCVAVECEHGQMISSITDESSAWLRARETCSRSVSLSAFTSNITSRAGHSRRAPPRATEKSSSRRAESRLENGLQRMHYPLRAAQASPPRAE